MDTYSAQFVAGQIASKWASDRPDLVGGETPGQLTGRLRDRLVSIGSDPGSAAERAAAIAAWMNEDLKMPPAEAGHFVHDFAELCDDHQLIAALRPLFSL